MESDPKVEPTGKNDNMSGKSSPTPDKSLPLLLSYLMEGVRLLRLVRVNNIREKHA